MKVAIAVSVVLAIGLGFNGLAAPWNGYLSALASATLWQSEGISGRVTVGPLVGGGACEGIGTTPPFWVTVSSGIVVVVHRSSDLAIYAPLNWTAIGNCGLLGTFRVELSPGTYSVDVSHCQSGCVILTAETTVIVEPHRFSTVNIDVNTHIL